MVILQAPARDASNSRRKSLFAERLRVVMTAKGLTVTATARLLQERLPEKKFNPVNMSHYLAGRSFPRPPILEALSDALGVSPEDLAPSATGKPALVASNDRLVAPILNGGADRSSVSTDRDDDAVASIPAFNLEDLASGEAWLQINQRLSWSTVIKILQVLKGG
jgi:transcriptional regulator with XRE-family HTH domain